MNGLICFWRDESGASATEYALTLALIGACVMLMAIGLGHAIGGAMNGATTCIEGHNGACRQTAGAEPIPAAAMPNPAAVVDPTPAADPASAADPAPSSGKPGNGKPSKPKKGCPAWAHCKR